MYPVLSSSSGASTATAGSTAPFGPEELAFKQQLSSSSQNVNPANCMKPKPNRQVNIIHTVKCGFHELEAAEALLEMGCTAKILITNSSFYDKNHHTTNSTITATATVSPTPAAGYRNGNGNGNAHAASPNIINGTAPSPATAIAPAAADFQATKKRKIDTNGTSSLSIPVDSYTAIATSPNNRKPIAAATPTTTTTANGTYEKGSHGGVTPATGDHFEDIENSLDDKPSVFEEAAGEPGCRVTFAPRSEEDKRRMRNNLIEFLTEEDIRYLRDIHEAQQKSSESKYQMPFGSDSVNKSHLSVNNNRETMIDEHEASEPGYHPQWWRGCSRCDVITVRQDKTPVDEGLSYSDLKELIRSHIEQLAVMRGEQRVLPPGPLMKKHEFVEFVKTFTLRSLERKFRRLRRTRRGTSKTFTAGANNTTTNTRTSTTPSTTTTTTTTTTAAPAEAAK